MLLSLTTNSTERDAMKLDIDNHELALPCPGCGKKVEEKIGRLRTNPDISCPSCGASIKIDADELNQGIKAVEKQLDALRASFKKFGK
ncbi:hypothetical protein ACPRNU_21330 [Chromobacterium vaccinii]|uniref:hypothetical protein n=1 Tax=Chromobacterium vaccinii TaxID=1108595 RepID=UPI003C73E51A